MSGSCPLNLSNVFSELEALRGALDVMWLQIIVSQRVYWVERGENARLARSERRGAGREQCLLTGNEGLALGYCSADQAGTTEQDGLIQEFCSQSYLIL